MANEISKTPTPTLASGQSEVLISRFVFSPTATTSPIINVDREPVKVVVMGLTGDAEIRVNQVVGVNDELLSEPYLPYPEGIVLNANRNEVILHRSGRYQLEMLVSSSTESTAFWWTFSMTHEWYDEIAEALRYLCDCVRPNEVTLVAGNGILVEDLGGGTWRVTNTAIHTADDSTTVDHQIVEGVLSSHVKLSEDPGNEMFARDDGLYATLSDPNAPCNLGTLVQPFNGLVRNARFLVLDNQGCIRWVRARSLANYVCEFECEEEPPPPNCCALTFSHVVQTLESIGVGTTINITLTATGSNAAICRAFTNPLTFAPIVGQTINGWRFQGTSFTGQNPYTSIDFHTANITSWSVVFTFVAVECNPVGRNVAFTATGNCRNNAGQLIDGSQVSYPVSVNLPAITEDCGEEPPPPPSCCALIINISSTPPTVPVAVGATFDVTVISIAAFNPNCHGRLFVNDLSDLTPTGWVIDSVTSTPASQDIRFGVNHSTAGTNFVTNVIRLRAVSCVSSTTRTFTVSGACFNSFGNQLGDTFVSESVTISFPQVNANCEGEPPPTCSSAYSHTFSSISAPVSVGDSFYLEVTLTGQNAVLARTKNFALSQPFPIPSGWTVSEIDVFGLPSSFNPTTSEVDFYFANVTSFTVRYTFTASALNSGGSTNFTVGARCVDNLGNLIPGTNISYTIPIQFPAVTQSGSGPSPNCCGLNFEVESVIPVGAKCEIATVVFRAESNSPTPECAARTGPFALVGNFVPRFQIISEQTQLLDGSPAPFDARNGVDFRTWNVSGWKYIVQLRAVQCDPQQNIYDVGVSFSGGCVSKAGSYIGGTPTLYSDVAVIGSPTLNCDAICD
jgi:hypothetical protein